MRLAERLKQHIIRSVLASFGDVDIYLFGSRVDDAKRGGDIDIAIDVELSTEQFKHHKIQFISSLIRVGLDLKIDIVPYNSEDKLLRDEIHRSALKLN